GHLHGGEGHADDSVADHDHDHDDDGDHSDARHGAPALARLPSSVRHDHNLWSAYLHVLADALTSLLAIVALLAAKYLGWLWMDPVMGIVGAVLVARWSFGLLRTTSAVLLDKTAPDQVCAAIRESIEGAGGHRIADLHVWSLGTEQYCAAL